LDAGFRTEQVDMEAAKLVFRRARQQNEPRSSSRPGKHAAGATGAAHHPMLGALKGLVQIMPGTDLTEPADPSWGDVWDEAK
jgi:hypothetical protein